MKFNTETAKKMVRVVTNNKALIATVTAGAIAGAYIDDSFEKNRYPVALEYQIISECTEQSYASRKMQSPVRTCICALEKTMNEISYEERISTSFSSTFEHYLRTCASK